MDWEKVFKTVGKLIAATPDAIDRSNSYLAERMLKNEKIDESQRQRCEEVLEHSQTRIVERAEKRLQYQNQSRQNNDD